jgi:hypothetical protein
MNRKNLYVEQRPQGDFAVRKAVLRALALSRQRKRKPLSEPAK